LKYPTYSKSLTIVVPNSIIAQLKGRAKEYSFVDAKDIDHADLILAAICKTFGWECPSHQSEQALKSINSRQEDGL